MKTQDLRIGNWINFPFHNEDVQIIGLPLLQNLKQGIQVKTLGTELCEPLEKQFSPIPLTEEWLVRFGFEKREPDDDYNYWGILNFTVLYGRTMDRDFSFFLNGYHNDCNIQYVHQLQNLYFALTGEELTLDK